VRVLSVNGAADALGGSQNFLAGSLQLTGHGPGPHHAGDGQNVFEANVSTVLDCKLRISAVNRGIKHGTIQCMWARFWLFLNTYYIVKYNNQMIIDK